MGIYIKTFLILRGSLSCHRNDYSLSRYFSMCSSYFNKYKVISEKQIEADSNFEIPEIVKYVKDKKILYNSFVHSRRIRSGYKKRRELEERFKKKEIEKKKNESIPLIIGKLLDQNDNIANYNISDFQPAVEDKIDSFNLPYSAVEDINISYIKGEREEKAYDWNQVKNSVPADIAARIKAYDRGEIETENDNVYATEQDSQWACPNAQADDIMDIIDDKNVNYGSCDPDIPASNVPCGGCGAHLHSQQYSLPGFLPKELFAGLSKVELRGVVCQRCYFLKHHDMALNVRVAPEIYEKLLEPIKFKKALIIVVVDLTDLPCSIWPNILDIVGTRRPVVVVGNKVDLLPADGNNHLKRIKDCFTAAINRTSLAKTNIKHITLVSAQTGFGIESLITKVHKSWGTNGDIYLIGCTNTGKSSLFNALLGSDMCKTKASDLIQRATTSPWPGTTLNMLKFPLLRPSGYKLYLRTQRLKNQQTETHLKEKSNEKYTTSIPQATLSGHIGRTFKNCEPVEVGDPFSIKGGVIPKEKLTIKGIKESDPEYAKGNWFYDTPGTVQPDQMINLLTHEELMKTLPQELLQPKTYYMKSGNSLLLGGLARLDLLYCNLPVWFTVFASKDIPITILKTVDASAIYRDYLGTSLLGVPFGGEERLKHWPVLKPVNFCMESNGSKTCSADVVLSSAGWISVTGKQDQVIEVRGWSPGGRGIYLRQPPMLPNIIQSRGKRLEKTPVFKPHKLFIPKSNI